MSSRVKLFTVHSDLRATLAGKDLPEDVKQRLLAMHEENITLKDLYKTAQEKLAKAKQFIKSQDKLFKEQFANSAPSVSVNLSLRLVLYLFWCSKKIFFFFQQSGTFEEAEASFRSQIKVLEEDLARQKVIFVSRIR